MMINEIFIQLMTFYLYLKYNCINLLPTDTAWITAGVFDLLKSNY